MIIKINESDWNDSIYRTKEWEESVKIIKWIHDYENKIYIIEYNEL